MPASRPRLHSTRGCDQCKQRRKKCDEVHPQCSGCIRMRLACSWVGASTKPSAIHTSRCNIDAPIRPNDSTNPPAASSQRTDGSDEKSGPTTVSRYVSFTRRSFCWQRGRWSFRDGRVGLAQRRMVGYVARVAWSRIAADMSKASLQRVQSLEVQGDQTYPSNDSAGAAAAAAIHRRPCPSSILERLLFSDWQHVVD